MSRCWWRLQRSGMLWPGRASEMPLSLRLCDCWSWMKFISSTRIEVRCWRAWWRGPSDRWVLLPVCLPVTLCLFTIRLCIKHRSVSTLKLSLWGCVFSGLVGLLWAALVSSYVPKWKNDFTEKISLTTLCFHLNSTWRDSGWLLYISKDQFIRWTIYDS